MSERRIAVVSSGLSNPSSTRMLADRLAAETARALRERDIDNHITAYAYFILEFMARMSQRVSYRPADVQRRVAG